MASLKLVIGNKNYSSWSMRPWLALTVAGLDFQEVVIGLDQPDTKARILEHSPAGRVPVLIDGAVTVWESLAILEYVAEKAPKALLWPSDPAARAHARAISAEMHAGFAAMRQHLPMNLWRARNRRDLTPAVRADVTRIMQMWHDTRARFGAGGPFLFGAFGAADCMYAPVVTRFDTYDVEVDGGTRAYMNAILKHPAFRAWHAGAMAEKTKGPGWVLDKEEVD
jgi:glutathione S-transferase